MKSGLIFLTHRDKNSLLYNQADSTGGISFDRRKKAAD